MKLEIDHDDAMMVIYAQNDDDSLKSRASSSLLVHLLRPKYFTSLRTEQQLGYVVTAIQAEYENQVELIRDSVTGGLCTNLG